MLEGMGYNILETPDKEVGIELHRKEEKENRNPLISSLRLC